MKSKLCTSIEQSKKLLELGLDPETADMYRWQYNGKEYLSELSDGEFCSNTDDYCWSLSALMDLMPKELELLSDESVFIPVLSRYYDDTDRYICCYNNGGMEHWYINDTPLDAAYSMVIWLIEQGYIKTEKK